MNIKSVENFTLKECREYLNMNPNGSERFSVEARMNAILKQNEYNKEQKEIQKRLEQEQYEKDVRWIDFKQFFSEHKYHRLSCPKIILWVLLISAGFLLAASFYYSGTTHVIYSEYRNEQAEYTTGIEQLLLKISFIEPDYHYGDWEYPCYENYDLRDESAMTLLIILPAILILLIIIGFYHSPSLPTIYNIEQEEKTRFYRRTQNKRGVFGLHLCKKHKIIQVLPFEYDNIYYCGGDAYICVKKDKRGVYNTAKKKMVIEVAYNTIDIMQDGALRVVKNGEFSRFTTDGYRIIE